MAAVSVGPLAGRSTVMGNGRMIVIVIVIVNGSETGGGCAGCLSGNGSESRTATGMVTAFSTLTARHHLACASAISTVMARKLRCPSNIAFSNASRWASYSEGGRRGHRHRYHRVVPSRRGRGNRCHFVMEIRCPSFVVSVEEFRRGSRRLTPWLGKGVERWLCEQGQQDLPVQMGACA